MTELYLNDQRVVLPQDFTIDLYVNNPFFTKKGEYTYDIDIPLESPINARILNSIDRINIAEHKLQYQAIIRTNGKEIISGTATVLEVKDNNAKIQILAGNSELNFSLAEDLTLADLDLGDVGVIDAARAHASLEGNSTLFDFACTTVLWDADRFCDINDSKVSKANYAKYNAYSQDWEFQSDTKFVAQPYLIAIIRKVFKALGYSIDMSVLTQDEMFKRLLIVHHENTTKYNKMVPAWPVIDFITEIEKYMNVVFVKDVNRKKITVMRLQDFYAEAPTTIIPFDDVANQVDKEFDNEDDLYVDYENIGYNWPEFDEYKYWEISEDVKSISEFIDKPFDTGVALYGAASWADIEKEIMPNFMMTIGEFYNRNIIIVRKYSLNNLDYTDYYVVRRHHDMTLDNWDCWTHQVDMFAPVINDETEEVSRMNIVPAFIVHTQGDLFNNNGGAPIALTSIKSESSDKDESGLNEYITGSTPQDNVPEQMIVTLYDASVKNKCYLYENLYEDPQGQLPSNNQYGHMTIKGYKGMYKRYYESSMNIDTTQLYTVKFLNHGSKHDPRNIFHIKGGEFYCKRLKYTIDAKGLAPITEGEFYPLK